MKKVLNSIVLLVLVLIAGALYYVTQIKPEINFQESVVISNFEKISQLESQNIESSTMTAQELEQALADQSSLSGGVKTLTVGPDLVDCEGVVLQKCMIIDGDYFYDDILGFEHEEGFKYGQNISKLFKNNRENKM